MAKKKEREAARQISKGIQDAIDDVQNPNASYIPSTIYEYQGISRGENDIKQQKHGYVDGLRHAKEIVDGYVEYTKPKKKQKKSRLM